jgi:hypothetical protein
MRTSGVLLDVGHYLFRLLAMADQDVREECVDRVERSRHGAQKIDDQHHANTPRFCLSGKKAQYTTIAAPIRGQETCAQRREGFGAELMPRCSRTHNPVAEKAATGRLGCLRYGDGRLANAATETRDTRFGTGALKCQ